MTTTNKILRKRSSLHLHHHLEETLTITSIVNDEGEYYIYKIAYSSIYMGYTPQKDTVNIFYTLYRKSPSPFTLKCPEVLMATSKNDGEGRERTFTLSFTTTTVC